MRKHEHGKKKRECSTSLAISGCRSQFAVVELYYTNTLQILYASPNARHAQTTQHPTPKQKQPPNRHHPRNISPPHRHSHRRELGPRISRDLIQRTSRILLAPLYACHCRPCRVQRIARCLRCDCIDFERHIACIKPSVMFNSAQAIWDGPAADWLEEELDRTLLFLENGERAIRRQIANLGRIVQLSIVNLQTVDPGTLGSAI